MTVTPSCPALLIHDDDQFRRTLIATLDASHFSVTYTSDDEAVGILRSRRADFKVVLIGLDLRTGKGREAVTWLGSNRDAVGCGVIILGEATPELRTFAPWADETLLKPVDAAYVVTRSQVYCDRCS